MSERTVRQLVKDIAREVLESADMSPTRAAELGNQLSSLLSNCNAELTESDLEYKAILLTALRANEKANHAKIEAETSPQYRRFREAKDTRDTCVELIRSLRAYLRNAADEMRLTR
jgi:uncharacterized protein YjaG (DUF416 family)